MFQPQPTPYTPYASYGGTTDHNQEQNTFTAYQPTGLGSLSGGPIEFDNPLFSPVASYPALPLHLHQNRYGAMATPPTDDLAAQETLARAYQPELKTPMVGQKRSSLEITEEYAKADPIYVAKTLTLPRLYSHYRPVRGDGNCGWRAIGFSYIETLEKLGDKKLLEAECDRMIALTDWVATMTNHESWIFEDMRDCAVNLLREIGNHIHLGPMPEEKSLLLQPFNDPEESDGIVYWCRLLASAYLKANPESFQDFIPDLIGVESYCKDVLEPSSSEIEHLGMTLLFEVLLKPIGVAVDIVYLDRSLGTEVNVHYLKPEVPNAAGSTIHLLYRPGHYDILYKDTNVSRTQSLSQQQISENAAAHSNIQVNRVTSFAHRHSIQGTPGEYNGVDMSILVNMPTIFGPLQTSPGYAESYNSITDFSPPPTHAPSYSIDSSRTTHSISPASSVSPGPTIFPATTLPMHPHGITADASPTAGRIPLGASQFRPSMYQYKEDWGDAPAQGFQTSTFKNSHYNVSHYNNPNFQPEQWTPDCDEAVGKLTRRGTA